MVKNTLGDLNNHLFEQMERLNDESIQGEDLENELRRSKAVTDIAGRVIDNGKLVLDAQKFKDERLDLDNHTPNMLEGE